MTLGPNKEGWTEDNKQIRDFRLNTECASLFTSLSLSIRAHTSFLISGGANSVSKYKSSTLVGFRYHVMP